MSMYSGNIAVLLCPSGYKKTASACHLLVLLGQGMEKSGPYGGVLTLPVDISGRRKKDTIEEDFRNE